MTLNTPIKDELSAWDRDCLLHQTTHVANHARGYTPELIMTGGEEVYVTDRNGNKLLVAFAALYCVNAGYGRTEIAEAMAKQKVFHISKRQRKTDIQHHGQANNLRTGFEIAKRRRICHGRTLDQRPARLKPVSIDSAFSIPP